MPIVSVKSLPVEEAFDAPSILSIISSELALATDIEIEHIHASWEYFLPGHYAKAGNNPLAQPQKDHPVVVELFTPDFHSGELIAIMMTSIAESIALNTVIPLANIFIYHRTVCSGGVYDGGEVVTW